MHHADRLADTGLTATRAALNGGGPRGAGERLLSANYVCLQYERLMLGESTGQP